MDGCLLGDCFASGRPRNACSGKADSPDRITPFTKIEQKPGGKSGYRGHDAHPDDEMHLVLRDGIERLGRLPPEFAHDLGDPERQLAPGGALCANQSREQGRASPPPGNRGF